MRPTERNAVTNPRFLARDACQRAQAAIFDRTGDRTDTANGSATCRAPSHSNSTDNCFLACSSSRRPRTPVDDSCHDVGVLLAS